MIFEFLLPILGWLVLFGICFILYTQFFYKAKAHETHVEGQGLYTAVATFFWIVVYMCLSSIWSILYSLIDLKYPDVIGAASDYGSGLVSRGVIYDTFAFPLALVVVSSITAMVLAFWLISKFQKNPALRPARLYQFIRMLVYIGGAVMIFSGFVYVIYSWLYGNLPIAVFMKGIVAVAIVGITALYFYLTTDEKDPKNSLYSRLFAILLVLVTLATLFYSFQIVGTPAEARIFRLDSLTLQNLQTVKSSIDNEDRNANTISSLDELSDEYAKSAGRQSGIIYTNTGAEFTLCANFNADMPTSINLPNKDTTWDYKAGNNCFKFKHLAPYPNVQIPNKPAVIR